MVSVISRIKSIPPQIGPVSQIIAKAVEVVARASNELGGGMFALASNRKRTENVKKKYRKRTENVSVDRHTTSKSALLQVSSWLKIVNRISSCSTLRSGRCRCTSRHTAMGCASSKILAGAADPPASLARKASYMTQPEADEIIDNEDNTPEVAVPVQKETDGMMYTNLEDINDRDALKDDAKMNASLEGDDAIIDPEGAEAKLQEYKKKLKEDGLGTKRKKSTNKGLIMAKDIRGVTVKEKNEVDVASNADSLLMEINQAKLNGNGNGNGSGNESEGDNVVVGSLAEGGSGERPGEELNDNDFDF